MFLYFWMFSKIPKTNGMISINGLKDEVKVYRDDFGIPHIFAKNKEDMYFVLGYVHASERLFQLEIYRRLVHGRLSELIGSRGVVVDKFFRTLGLKRNSVKWFEKNYKKIPKDALEATNSYIKGLNYYLKNEKTPIEYTILGIEKEPFERSDILGVVAFMAFSFGEALRVDPIISSLEEEYGSEKIEELVTENANHSTFIMEGAKEFSLNMGNTMQEVQSMCYDYGLSLFQGSNSWVLSPSKTKSGNAVLSNDPHIMFSNPSIWFEAYLHSGDFELHGFFLPLTPLAAVGFNQDIAWGLTMFCNDDMDLYKETIDPNNITQTIFRGKPIPIKTIDEPINVRFSSTVPFQVRETNHGPILNGNQRFITKLKYPVSLRWRMFDDDNRPLKAFWGMNTANNLQEFETALAYLKAPGLNIVYADKNGNIAYWGVAGLHRKGYVGDRILDGSSGKFEWGEKIPFQMNPQLKNPKSGFLFTANNRHSQNLPYTLFGYWQADDRSNRIGKLLSGEKKFSMDDLKSIIIDDYFEAADYLLPPLLKAIEKKYNSLNPVEKKTFGILKKWNKRGSVNTPGGAIFSEYRYYLARWIFWDEMGDERFKFIAGSSRIHHFLKWTVLNRKSSWWNDIRTKTVETPEEIMFKAYTSAIATLMGKLGDDLDDWKWGDLHTLELVHPLGRMKPFHLLFNSGPRRVGGGSETINNQISRFYFDDHKVKAGPSMRLIVDFGDLENVQIINPLGISGHRLSKDFQSQADMYVEGKFRVVNLLKVENSKERLTLVPKK